MTNHVFLGFKGNGGHAMSVFVASIIGAEDVGQATSRKLPLSMGISGS